jgi:RND superfamily putative drug exporter
MRSPFSFPAGRRAKWVVFAVWIVVVAGVNIAGLPTKFMDAEKNDSASFLPGAAESTKALAVTKKLNRGDVAPSVVVYRRSGGLTAQDRQRIEGDVVKLNAATRRFKNTTPFGNPQNPRSPGPVVSRDGSTALIGNLVKGTGEGKDIIDPVKAYRKIASGEDGGLSVKVAGPAGISADAIKVFEGINGTLLAAAGGLVLFLLILIYRSPLFWIFPLLAVVFAELASRGFGYGLSELGVTVNGQSSSLLSVLVLGAGTDYALLLVARYREELARHQDKHEAMALALRSAGPAIFASGLTVCAALLTLTLAEVNGTAGLGPIGAMGVAVAMLVMLTFLPALLTIVGRRRFWPFVPYGPDGPDAADHVPMARGIPALGPLVTALAVVGGLIAILTLVGSPGTGAVIALVVVALVALFRVVGPRIDRSLLLPFERRLSLGRPVADSTHGVWRRLGERVARNPRRVALGAAGLLALCALGLLNFSTGLTQGNSFRDSVESIQGQDLIAKAFPGGQSAPTDIVLRDAAKIDGVARAAEGVEGVAAVPVKPARQGPEGIQLAAFLERDPYSTEAFAVIPRLRDAVRSADPRALVGGPTAIEYDLRQAATDDTLLLVPIALVIVLLILVVLLRAIVAPLLLIGTVLLSFAASLGVGVVVFDVIFGFPGSDTSLPLFAFIFLVALGVDYNIFLMARVREEALKHGTREGMLRGLAVTGGVITSAGIVLAGTFAVLAVLPLVFLTELGFVIAFGVLLDTFLVRSVLVPALAFDVGPKIWWPSTLASSIHHRRGRPAEAPPVEDPVAVSPQA